MCLIEVVSCASRFKSINPPPPPALFFSANNPVVVAVHEAMRLFPNSPVSAIVSIGNKSVCYLAPPPLLLAPSYFCFFSSNPTGNTEEIRIYFNPPPPSGTGQPAARPRDITRSAHLRLFDSISNDVIDAATSVFRPDEAIRVPPLPASTPPPSHAESLLAPSQPLRYFRLCPRDERCDVELDDTTPPTYAALTAAADDFVAASWQTFDAIAEVFKTSRGGGAAPSDVGAPAATPRRYGCDETVRVAVAQPFAADAVSVAAANGLGRAGFPANLCVAQVVRGHAAPESLSSKEFLDFVGVASGLTPTVVVADGDSGGFFCGWQSNVVLLEGGGVEKLGKAAIAMGGLVRPNCRNFYALRAEHEGGVRIFEHTAVAKVAPVHVYEGGGMRGRAFVVFGGLHCVETCRAMQRGGARVALVVAREGAFLNVVEEALARMFSAIAVGFEFAAAVASYVPDNATVQLFADE
jgi:hypothetical protein